MARFNSHKPNQVVKTNATKTTVIYTSQQNKPKTISDNYAKQAAQNHLKHLNKIEWPKPKINKTNQFKVNRSHNKQQRNHTNKTEETGA